MRYISFIVVSTKLNCACLEKRRLSMPLFLTRFIKFLAFNGYQYPPISNIRNGQLCSQPQIVMIQTAWIWLSLDEADKISWANHNFLDNLTNLLSRYMYTVRSSCTFPILFTMTIMALKLRSFIQSIEQLISFMHLRSFLQSAQMRETTITLMGCLYASMTWYA